jgi:hypothetical protein
MLDSRPVDPDNGIAFRPVPFIINVKTFKQFLAPAKQRIQCADEHRLSEATGAGKEINVSGQNYFMDNFSFIYIQAVLITQLFK